MSTNNTNWPIQENLEKHDYFWHINSANTPQQVELPAGEKLYSINLNTRIIEGPEDLSVLENHEADLLYFTVDRFYDNVDLSTTTCIIQYETTNKNDGSIFRGIYCIPFYDIVTLAEEEKMILPWQVRNSVTQSASLIKYNFRFYIIEDGIIKYNLNTLTATSKILNTLSNSAFQRVFDKFDEEINKDTPIATQLELIWDAISNGLKWNQTNWEILD